MTYDQIYLNYRFLCKMVKHYNGKTDRQSWDEKTIENAIMEYYNRDKLTELNRQSYK